MVRAPLLFTCFTFVALCLLLMGCSSAPKPPIGAVSLNVQPNINPFTTTTAETEAPEARPVVIRFYELTSLAAFNSADFFSVFNDYKTALENELITSEEFRLTPGQKMDLWGGFMEFFGKYGKEEKMQVWETSFPLTEKKNRVESQL